jgi:Pectate lyase superfamily protein
MPFNGNGTFVLPGPPLEPGEIVSADEHNELRDDMAAGFTDCVTRDGQSPAVANLPMGTFKHTNVGAANTLTNYSRVDQVQNDSFNWLTSVSGTDTITASSSIAPAAYAAGQRFAFIPSGSNTGAATININSLGAKSIKINGTDDLYAGFLNAGTVYTVVYDGTNFQVALANNAGVFYVERFSGDGSETVFTLSHSAISENYLLVYIYGVYQQKDTYTFSGNTLTFSVAPPLGTDNIEVVISSTLALGETDASQVEYTLPAVGAVTQTVEAKLSETVSVKDFGAVGDGVTDDSAAFAAAIAASKNIFIPEGTYLVDTVLVTGDGYNIQGASPTSTIIKARTSATTNLFSISGVSSYATNNVVKNLLLDMSNMTDSSSSHGLNMQKAYDCSIEQVNVIGNGTSKRTLYTSSNGSGGGVYTTVFTNCNFSSVTGTIELTGTSLSDATTTLTFVGCSFAKCVATNCVAITFIQPIVQGALNKFDLSNIDGFSIISGDIEGTGTFLVIGSNVNHLCSTNNEFGGFVGTYSSGTFLSGYTLDCYGSTPFVITPVNGTSQPTQHNGFIVEQTATANPMRKIIKNTNATSYYVDIQYTNANGTTYIGQSASGDSYVDNRNTGKVALQQSGTDRVGVTAANLLIVGTTTATTANAGSNGAPPAQVSGYIRFVNSAGTEIGKIPYYAT